MACEAPTTFNVTATFCAGLYCSGRRTRRAPPRPTPRHPASSPLRHAPSNPSPPPTPRARAVNAAGCVSDCLSCCRAPMSMSRPCNLLLLPPPPPHLTRSGIGSPSMLILRLCTSILYCRSSFRIAMQPLLPVPPVPSLCPSLLHSGTGAD